LPRRLHLRCCQERRESTLLHLDMEGRDVCQRRMDSLAAEGSQERSAVSRFPSADERLTDPELV
jgi:cell fate regulator YaaT (PSP1 superfamily)